MRFKSQSCRIPLHCFALLILCLGCQLIYSTERRQCFAGFGLVLVDATQQLPCPPSLFSCTASHRPTVWDFTVVDHDLTALTSNRRAHQVDVLPNPLHSNYAHSHSAALHTDSPYSSESASSVSNSLSPILNLAWWKRQSPLSRIPSEKRCPCRARAQPSNIWSDAMPLWLW